MITEEYPLLPAGLMAALLVLSGSIIPSEKADDTVLVKHLERPHDHDLLPCSGHNKKCMDLPPEAYGEVRAPSALLISTATPHGPALAEISPEGAWQPVSEDGGNETNVSLFLHAGANVNLSALGHTIGINASIDVEANSSIPQEPPGNGSGGEEREYAIPCQQDGVCPDLSVDGIRLLQFARVSTTLVDEDDCNVAEGNTEPGVRSLLRFTTKTPNLGEGDLALGDPSGKPYFEWATCHEHWHFQSYADYRLWNASTYVEWVQHRQNHPDKTADEVMALHPGLLAGLMAGHKQGFCLIDVELAFIIAPIAATHHRSCDNQGISPGWADVYGSNLDGQFVDVTGVEPGAYVLEAEVNPDWIIEEEELSNNAAAILVIIT